MQWGGAWVSDSSLPWESTVLLSEAPWSLLMDGGENGITPFSPPQSKEFVSTTLQEVVKEETITPLVSQASIRFLALPYVPTVCLPGGTILLCFI